ncbi:MAG: hypothetical protein LBT46_14285 [Planctomycetaceae bacterium]|nr:hypothetical protein [Planctomycetaceae bacterium]
MPLLLPGVTQQRFTRSLPIVYGLSSGSAADAPEGQKLMDKAYKGNACRTGTFAVELTSGGKDR